MKNHTLYRYDLGWDEFEKAEFAKDYEECYDEKPTEKELINYIEASKDNDWGDMMSEIDCYEKTHGSKQYVIMARIGTWRGTFDSSKIVTGMKKAISVCIRDCEYVTVFYKNNQFKIIGHHHDGTNTFIIRELTDKGSDYAERHEYDFSDYELHKRIFNSSHLSHMVSIFPKIYGWV